VVRRGHIETVHHHRLPLAQSVEAIRLLLDRKAYGKVVVLTEPG